MVGRVSRQTTNGVGRKNRDRVPKQYSLYVYAGCPTRLLLNFGCLSTIHWLIFNVNVTTSVGISTVMQL
jgi:hypothetical protein